MKRILFVAEGITMAQIVRLRVLAGALDPARYEVHFACSAFPSLVFADTRFLQWQIASVDADTALRAAEQGRAIYDERTLVGYAEDEARLFKKIEPDLVVGDLRWSLAATAPAHGVRFAALINAYWSPHAQRRAFPVPEHPMVALLGQELAMRFLPYAMPVAFAAFAEPVNALRRRMGLAPIGSLLEVLTYADDVLFADIPELTPVSRLAPGQRYLGAVCWSPDTTLPGAWDGRVRGSGDGPRVYVTLGSSGRADLLPVVLDALHGVADQVLVATAARAALGRVPSHVTVAEFVPGHLAARAADLVICNGGSSTGYQALLEGTPVLGLPANLDQYLAMTAIQEAGAGFLVRSGQATAAAVRAGVQHLLREPGYRARADALSKSMRAVDAGDRFRAYVDEVLA